MKTYILSLGVLLFQSMVGFSQSQEATNQSQQKEKIYYGKKLIPQGENYVTTAPVTNSYAVTINVPIDKVWEVIDDTPNFPKWFPGVKSGSMIDPNEKEMGSKRLAHLKSFKYYEEIIAYEPNKAWGFTMIESNSGACRSITEVIYLEAIDANTTKVIYKGGYEYKGMYKWMAGMMTKQITKIWKGALEGLKEYTESNSK